jgi:hypothetical protein
MISQLFWGLVSRPAFSELFGGLASRLLVFRFLAGAEEDEEK